MNPPDPVDVSSGSRLRVVRPEEPWTFSLAFVPEIFAPLAKLTWLCGGLGIAPGAVTLLSGYGYSGKSLVAQSIALSVASGAKLWGHFDVIQGRVVHLDYEQGRRLSFERYQRLARGMQLDAGDLDPDALGIECLPSHALTAEGARPALRAILDGAVLCVIDSLLASLPGVDENSSDSRRYLDMISSVSEDTKCSVIVLPHSRKDKAEDDDKRQKLRGSSALFDAAQAVYLLHAPVPGPIHVTQTKDRLRGKACDPFWLTPTDLASEDGADPVWGVRLDYKSAEREPKEARAKVDPSAAFDRDCAELLRLIPQFPTANAGIFAQRMGRRKCAVLAMLEHLETCGKVVNLGTYHKPDRRPAQP